MKTQIIRACFIFIFQYSEKFFMNKFKFDLQRLNQKDTNNLTNLTTHSETEWSQSALKKLQLRFIDEY